MKMLSIKTNFESRGMGKDFKQALIKRSIMKLHQLSEKGDFKVSF